MLKLRTVEKKCHDTDGGKKGSVMIINKKNDDTARSHWNTEEGSNREMGRGHEMGRIYTLHTYQGKLQRTPCLCLWPTYRSKKKCSRNKWVQSRDQKHCVWLSASLTTEPTAGAARSTEDAVQRQTQHTPTHTGTFHYSTLNNVCRNRESLTTGGIKVKLK